MTKPDFIIMGAMKSATSTMHEQLALQPGIFMSTPKEPNYFSDDLEYARGDDWYSGLFLKASPSDLCGESSTHYTKLPDYPLTIERMKKKLHNPKFIYIMRHPIDRLISHYIHQWSQNVIKCDINEAIDKHEELIAYSCYSRQLSPYFEAFGTENVLPLFSEVIRISPQKQLQRVADFIGFKQTVSWQFEEGPKNVSNKRIREFKGYKWVVESKVMTYLRRALVSQEIRDRIKNKLTMQHRPEIDEVHLARLIEIFNKDLAGLGTKFGIELSCNNYSTKVINKELNWVKG